MPGPLLPPPVSHSTIRRRDEPQQRHHNVKCERCGKQVDSRELKNGLCQECNWQINVGEMPQVKEKKHHFWSRSG